MKNNNRPTSTQNHFASGENLPHSHAEHRSKHTLHFVFMLTTFIILSLTSSIVALLVYVATHYNLLDANSIISILIMAILSIALGTFIFSMVGKTFLKPIREVTQATKIVAKGDFSVQLDEQHPIHEIQAISQNFNIMVRELRSIETLQNDFVLNVSHEFKTPIAAIEGCATLLQDETATPQERREYVGLIMDATKQLSSLTGNILNLSKLENNTFPLTKHPFRLDEQLRQVVVRLEHHWSFKEIELEVDLDEAVYNGNEELLFQVWNNLLSNAIKFTFPQGKILVSLYQTKKGISIQFTDNGMGIAPEEQNHIFEKFYQVETQRASHGNGLGLALAQRIIILHGGTISVKSELGQGSVFTVRLPKQQITQ